MRFIGRKNQSRGTRLGNIVMPAARDSRPTFESLEGRTLFSAVPGHLDATFGAAGLATASSTLSNISAAHAAVQADGKVVVVGHSADRFAVARFNANGTLDTSFGASHSGVVLTQAGPSGTTSAATSVAIQADGKIVVVGGDSGKQDFDVVRYRADGTPDTTFGNAGIVRTDVEQFAGTFGDGSNASVADVAVLPGGKIVVAGSAAFHGFLTSSIQDFLVTGYNANGSLDTSFGAESGGEIVEFGHHAFPSALAIDTNGTAATNPLFGTIVVAGTRLNDDNSTLLAVARLQSNGHQDSRFDGDGILTAAQSASTDAAGRGVVILPGGSVVVAGTLSDLQRKHSDFALVEFGSNGKIVPGFGSSSTGWQRTDFGGEESVSSLIQGFDGDLIVGGGTGGKFALAAYTADGKLDPRFGLGGKVTTSVGETSAVTGLASAPGRRFVAVGSGAVFHAARYFDAVPSVNIGTFNPDAYERGTQSTGFIVTRSERLPFATRVRLNLSGTARLKIISVVKSAAVAGATGGTGTIFGTGDYTLSGVGSDVLGYYVDIPAGQTFATVTVTPVDNGITNNSVKTAIFTVQGDNLYDVGTLSSVTINIHENDLPIIHLPTGGPVVVGNKI